MDWQVAEPYHRPQSRGSNLPKATFGHTETYQQNHSVQPTGVAFNE